MERRIVLDLAVTLDGLIEGKNGETDWCIMDEEMGFTEFLNGIDTIVYGRRSYDLWGQYMPATGDEQERALWSTIHGKQKVVFSRTRKATDRRAVFINDNIPEEVERLKNKPGKDIWLYGGASLITAFVNLDLVDEYRLSVHPVVLGEGKPLFVDIKQRLQLSLVRATPFSSGVVQLVYRRNGSPDPQ